METRGAGQLAPFFMVDRTFQLLLLLSPIVYGVSISLHKFDLRFFEMGAIALFVASLFDVPKRELGWFRLPIFLLLGLVSINSFWHKYQPQDIYTIQLLFFGILSFIIVVKYLKNPRACLRYIWWALGINIVTLLFQNIGYAPAISMRRVGWPNCNGGMIGNISRFGIYLALILPYLPFVVALILGAMFGVFWNFPQMGVLVPLGLMIFFNTKDRLYRFLIILGSITLIAIFHHKIWSAILMRWTVWRPIIDMIFEKPLLGWGFGTYYIWINAESFNTYLPFIYGTGLLGLVWVGWIGREFKKTFRPDRESIAVLSLAVLGLIEYPFDLPRLWFTIIAILGFYAIKQIERSRDESSLYGTYCCKFVR